MYTIPIANLSSTSARGHTLLLLLMYPSGCREMGREMSSRGHNSKQGAMEGAPYRPRLLPKDFIVLLPAVELSLWPKIRCAGIHTWCKSGKPCTKPCCEAMMSSGTLNWPTWNAANPWIPVQCIWDREISLRLAPSSCYVAEGGVSLRCWAVRCALCCSSEVSCVETFDSIECRLIYGFKGNF